MFFFGGSSRELNEVVDTQAGCPELEKLTYSDFQYEKLKLNKTSLSLLMAITDLERDQQSKTVSNCSKERKKEREGTY